MQMWKEQMRRQSRIWNGSIRIFDGRIKVKQQRKKDRNVSARSIFNPLSIVVSRDDVEEKCLFNSINYLKTTFISSQTT